MKMNKTVRRSTANCSVVNCGNNTLNSPGLPFYRFPTSNPLFPHKAARRDVWVTAVRRQEPDGSVWNPKNNNRICGAHFVGNMKSEDPRSPSYHPTIFPYIYKKSRVDPQVMTQRYQRRLRRMNEANKQVVATNSKKLKVDKTCSSLSDETVSVSVGNLECHEYKPVDRETQINPLEYNESNQQVFRCNRYVNWNVYEAEIQASGLKISTLVKVEQIELCEETCETNVQNDVITKLEPDLYGFSSMKSDQEMFDLAGVTRNTFELLLNILSAQKMDFKTKIRVEVRLIIFLIKIKSGLTFTAIGALLPADRSTMSRIFYSVLKCLSTACKNFVTWPSRDVVVATMPLAFKEMYANCRVIIDCIEFKVEKPPTVEERERCYSHSKNGFRIKVLVGCTPSGLISTVSKAYGVTATNAQITIGSGLLELLEPGEFVLANKGFPQMKTIPGDSGRDILIVMPPHWSNNSATEKPVEDTCEKAAVRTHIKRIMQKLQTYKILDMITIDMLPCCNQIIFMCCVLINLEVPVIKRSNSEENLHDGPAT